MATSPPASSVERPLISAFARGRDTFTHDNISIAISPCTPNAKSLGTIASQNSRLETFPNALGAPQNYDGEIVTKRPVVSSSIRSSLLQSTHVAHVSRPTLRPPGRRSILQAAVRADGNQVNRKLLEVERVSHQCVLTQEALDRSEQPIPPRIHDPLISAIQHKQFVTLSGRERHRGNNG